MILSLIAITSLKKSLADLPLISCEKHHYQDSIQFNHVTFKQIEAESAHDYLGRD